MSAKSVDYHQGAIADVKSAVAWYRKRSPKAALDFIEELHRASETIRGNPERWADREKQHETVLASALSVCHYLFRTGIQSDDLGGRPR